jgi:hypothetical protein
MDDLVNFTCNFELLKNKEFQLLSMIGAYQSTKAVRMMHKSIFLFGNIFISFIEFQ